MSFGWMFMEANNKIAKTETLPIKVQSQGLQPWIKFVGNYQYETKLKETITYIS